MFNRLKIKFFRGVLVPKGVNVFVVENPQYGGVFYTPTQAVLNGFSKFPTICIEPGTSLQIFIHEVGHFIHWKYERESYGWNLGYDERYADQLGAIYYRKVTRKNICMRNKQGNLFE
jgi:hypothetical protein